MIEVMIPVLSMRVQPAGDVDRGLYSRYSIENNSGTVRFLSPAIGS